MRSEVTIYIDGRKADTYRNESVTLDFNSSMLSDISSIKCSGSKTIKLPKTTTNDAIFDLPHMPSYESSKAHKVLSCAMEIDGISIFGNGLCHLLASDGDHYEIAVTFGVMHGNFSEWISNKPKLRDLQQSESDFVPWKSDSVSLGYGGESQIEGNEYMPSMYYAKYNCGISDKNKINIHPCVTLNEIYARIVRQHSLNITLPTNVSNDMNNKAVILKKNNVSLNTLSESLKIGVTPSEIWHLRYSDNVKRLFFDIDSEAFDAMSSTFVQIGSGRMSIRLSKIYLNFVYNENTTSAGLKTFLPAVQSSPNDYALVIEPVSGVSRHIAPVFSGKTLIYNIDETFDFNIADAENYIGKPLLRLYIKLKKWQDIPDAVWESPNSKYYVAGVVSHWNDYSLRDTFRLTTSYGGNQQAGVTVSYQENNNGYPMDRFTFSENLPDITQLDFINFVCKFYGLFPMQDGDEVTFVPFSRLFDNIDAGNVYDWSKALTEQYLDCPNNVSQTIDGYAQSNTIKYKEDKKDPVELTASLVVEDESLEQEKKLIEFPFSASRGNIIPQYSLSEEGELVKNDCEYRLMRITYGENYTDNALRFTDDMTPLQIVNRHYSQLQDVIRKPMQIEEEMMLSLIDLQAIDYSKPVYLSKYGRYFAIISIQWTSDKRTSKVKLLRIK